MTFVLSPPILLPGGFFSPALEPGIFLQTRGRVKSKTALSARSRGETAETTDSDPVLHLLNPSLGRSRVAPVQHGRNRRLVARNDRFDRTLRAILYPAGYAESHGLLAHGFAKPHPLHSAVNMQVERSHFTFIPGSAPESGVRIKSPGASPDAASTMPSDRPNFILRGARLATITVSRPTSCAGS